MSFLANVQVDTPSGPLDLEEASVLLALARYLDDENDDQPPPSVMAIATEVLGAIDAYVSAGGTADGLDWFALSDVERKLVEDAVVRHRAKERSDLAYQIGLALGSEVADEGVVATDEVSLSLKAKMAAMRQARAAQRNGKVGS